MNKNFNVIKITGFKGLLIVLFLISCFAAGFMILPGWICMNVWNYVSGFFIDMPRMTLLHGAIFWLIIVLSMYALNKGNFAVSFGSASTLPVPPNEERIKEIIKKINEHNSNIVPVTKHQNSDNDIDENSENGDKIKK